jgi:two-component system response regulator HydG
VSGFGHLDATMPEQANILIIDDDEDILSSCRLLLKKRVGNIVTSNDPRNIPALMAENAFHAILLDMNFRPGDNSGEQGLRWLRRILEIDSNAVVTLITAFSSVDAAVEAMKLGAHDFIEKPWNNEKLISTLNAAIQLRRSREEVNRFKQTSRMLAEDIQRRHHPIIGQSHALQNVLSIVRKAAPPDANVLILGENGTGKELIAREIHALSQRAEEAFVSVDLSAVPSTLLESELFGHKKGAFTDAREERMGRFQAANRGTFFLDEIGNLPLSLQPKLLTVLENRMVTPLGSTRAEPIDIRLLSATNVSEQQLKNPETFRPDLLYRLNTVEIRLPPLRECNDDIPLLANAFVREYTRKYNRPVESISNEAMSLLMNYRWPGNVRELRYSVERAVILSDGDELGIQDFISLADSPPPPQQDSPPPVTGQTLDDIEKDTIEQALRENQGNISHAARALGLTRASLYRRIEKHGL